MLVETSTIQAVIHVLAEGVKDANLDLYALSCYDIKPAKPIVITNSSHQRTKETRQAFNFSGIKLISCVHKGENS